MRISSLWTGGVALVSLILQVLSGEAPSVPVPREELRPLPPEFRTLEFEANHGQLAPGLVAMARASGFRVLVRSDGLTLQPSSSAADSDSLRLAFVGSRPGSEVEPIEPLPGTVNYLAGDDPQRWIRGIPTYSALVARELYPGVDLDYRGDDRRLELRLAFAPGADPEQLLVDLGGRNGAHLDPSGDWVRSFGAAEVRLSRPVARQGDETRAAEWLLDADGALTIRIEDHDPEASLIVRTNVRCEEKGSGPIWNVAGESPRLSTGANGDVYVTGRIDSALPVPATTRRSAEGAGSTGIEIPVVELADAFVTRLAADGTVLQRTYFGGDGKDEPLDVAVDSQGRVYVVGSTDSRRFPRTLPASGDSTDAFVILFDVGGAEPIFATRFGGPGVDEVTGITLDGDDRPWIVGRAAADAFVASEDALQPAPAGNGDAFFARLDPVDGRLLLASYLGGSDVETGRGIAADAEGNIYLVGETRSADFPVAAALQAEHGGRADVFVAKLAPDGRTPIYVTLLGGAGDDVGWGIATDPDGYGYVVGTTGSSAFPLMQAEQPSFAGAGPVGHGDAFVAKLDPQGGSLVYATYLGGAGDDRGASIAVDAAGQAWIVGTTDSAGLPGLAGSPAGATDAFVSVIDPDGSSLRSRYLGGAEGESGSDIAIDAEQRVLVAGTTRSGDPGAARILEPALSGGDGFVATLTSAPSAIGCPGDVEFDNDNGDFLWQQPINWTGDALPVAGQDVCIDGFAVILGSGTHQIATLKVTGGGSLTINAGTLTIDSAAELDSTLTLAGGTLQGNSSVTVTGLFSWTGGTHSGAGSTNADGGIDLSGGTKTLSGSRVLNNAGTATWTAGGITMNTNAVLNNLGGAIFDAQVDANIAWNGGTPVFNNLGTFRKSAGSGVTGVTSIPLNNDGSVDVQTGTLRLAGGGTSSGSFDSTGAMLELDGGTFELLAGSSVTGDVFADSGTANVQGSWATNVLTASGTVLNFDNTTTPATTVTLDHSTGTIAGAGDLTISGLFSWTGGTHSGSGSTNANGGIDLSGTTKTLSGSRVLNNAGTAIWTAGGITMNTNAVLNNPGGAIFDAQVDANIAWNGGSPVFNNLGTFRKSAGTGVTGVTTMPLHNDGSVDVQTGTLRLAGGGTSSGSFDSTGAMLELDGGTFELLAGSSVTGDVFADSGTANVQGSWATNVLTASGTTLNFDNTTTPATTMTLDHSTGTIAGAGDLTISGLFSWTGGTQSGTGSTNANGGIDLSGTTKTLSGSRVLNNAGTATWTAGGITMNTNAVLNNLGGAIFDAQVDANIAWNGGTPVFNNLGTFRKSAGSGVTGVTTMPLHNAGSVDVQSGTLRLTGGGTSSGSFDATAATLEFGGGTHDLDGSSSVTATNLTVNAGTANFAGSVTISGSSTFSGGTANFTGSLTSAGAVQISSGTANFSNTEGSVALTTLDQSGGTLSGSSTVTVAGLFSWTGGTHSGTGSSNANGGIDLSGGTKTLSGSRLLNNAGTATWTAGQITMNTNAVLNNLGGAIFDAQVDANIAWNGGTPVFNNLGMFRKSAGSGVTGVTSIPLNNDGSVDVQTGTLRLASGGTSSGSFDSTGAMLELDGGTFELLAGSSVTGDVFADSGTANVQGSWATNVLTASGTVLNFDNTTTPATTLTLDHSTGTIAGAGDLTISGLFSWTGGTQSGTGSTNANGGIDLSGTTKTLSGSRVLNNAGTAIWTAGGITMNTNAVLNNPGGAIFDAQVDANIAWNGGSPVFNNLGTFRKSAGTGVTGVTSIPLHNDGSVDVQTGTLRLAGGGTSSGSFDSTGAMLELDGGTFELLAGSSVTGDVFADSGTANVQGSWATNVLTASGTTLNFDNTTTPATTVTLDHSTGTIAGAGDLTISGPFSWTGGTQSGSGSTNANGGIDLSGTTKTLSGSRVLNNAGTATWTAGGITMNTSAVLNNLGGAIFDAQVDANIAWNGGTPAFNNLGTFRKSAGAGTTSLSTVPFANSGIVAAQSGTLRFTSAYTQTAGVTRLDGGAISSTTLLDIQAGTLEGFGTASANVLVGGTTSPGLSPAILAIGGGYTQIATGAYNVEVGGLTAGTEYDQLNMTGGVVLSGVLDVSLINAFAPSLGDMFTIMTFASRSGAFSSVNLPPLGGGLQWEIGYGATSVVLSVGPTMSSDLAVTTSDSPDPVLEGNTLTYTLNVTNNGPEDANGVVLTDTLDPTVSFVSASVSPGSCVESGGVVTCDLGDLANGAGTIVTIQVTPNAGGTITNTATVTSNESDPIPGNNTDLEDTTVLPICPDDDNDGFVTCDGSCIVGTGDVCGDCNDADAAINPSAVEECDGIDNNCNGVADDGLGSVPELCNGEDDNCNGLVDEGNPEGGASCSAGGLGVCDAGTLVCDAGVLSCTADTGPGPELCNGLDDDCNGVADDIGDSDGDGVDNCLDNCVDAFNPAEDCDNDPGTPDEQCDADGDTIGDVCDCTPNNPGNPTPPEVGDSVFVSKGATPSDPIVIQWAAEPLASEYNVYRGYINPGLAFDYNQQCLETRTTQTQTTEPLDPRPFTVFYYLVSSSCAGDESVLGRDSTGTPVQQPFTCPALTLDNDGDGTEEAIDTCPGFSNPSQSDFDSDSHGDVCDNCPQDFDPTLVDQDGDGLGDVCDPDRDGDTILEDGDGSGTPGDGPCTAGNTANCDDNCPDDPNPGQQDADADGIGDVCDPS